MAAPMRKRLRSQYMSADEAIRILMDDIPSGSEDENLSEGDVEEEYQSDEEYEIDDDGDGGENDDEYVDDNDNSPQQKQKNVTDNIPRLRTWHWVKKDLPDHANPENNLIPCSPAAEARTPLEMFMCHFTEEAFELLTLESNRYMQQLGRSRPKPIEKQEIKLLVGICFYMSIVVLPNRRMYWSTNTRQKIIAEAMTVNRFEEILSVFHANDNELMKKRGERGYDRLHKVRPLLDIIGGSFQSCANPELFVSVDEQIIPFKGRHSLKVYMMKKPKKWGYKVWVQAGQSGYVHRFHFAGDNTVPSLDNDNARSVGKAGETVLQLTAEQEDGSYVFFDNYFASPELLFELRRRNINATCTIRANRTRGCPLLCKKDIKKKGRGAYDFRSSNDIIICQWYDNKVVLVASNVHGVEPAYDVRRYDRAAKEYITVKCPALIKSYNANMGGVDKCDMLLSLYRNEMKSTKWYKRIMFHLLDLCMVNAWLLYKVVIPGCSIPLADFKLAVASGLILKREANPINVVPVHGPRSHSAKGVNLDARYDRVDHFPVKVRALKNAQRCKCSCCTRKTMFMCRKCGVYLCVTSKDDNDNDCFYGFHHQ